MYAPLKISVVGQIKVVQMNAFLGTFQGFSPQFKTFVLRNSFSLKHLSMAIDNFWTYCGQSLAGRCLRQDIPSKTFSENFIKYFTQNGQTEWPNVWASKIFFHVSKLQEVLTVVHVDREITVNLYNTVNYSIIVNHLSK